jgi:enolase
LLPAFPPLPNLVIGFKVQPNDGTQRRTAVQMVELYRGFCEKFDMVSIEDPFEQDDWGPCADLTKLGICQVC